MTPTLIYCYDAYCGWCYGFSENIKKLAVAYKDILPFEVLSGGMIMNEKPQHISAMAGFIRDAYKTVEEYSGVKFGPDFLWHIYHSEESDWFPHSEKSAIALCIFKEQFPELQVEFAADLQYALNFEGRDLCDNEAYRHLLEKYEIDPDDFYTKLASPAYKEKAAYEFALCKQLNVTGFPCVFLQVSEQKLYMIARGYTAYNDLEGRLQKLLQEMAASN